jgi:hypothetical protein
MACSDFLSGHRSLGFDTLKPLPFSILEQEGRMGGFMALLKPFDGHLINAGTYVRHWLYSGGGALYALA